MHLISNFITSDKKAASLSSKFPMLSIRSEKDFFLECDAYDVIIPLRKQQTRNNSFSILERCILRLLSINSELSNEEISEKLCLGTCNGSAKKTLDSSFVKTVRARLKDNGLIEASGAVTKKGENVIKLVVEAEDDETDETLVQVFCIRQLNNKLLSYIHVGAIESEIFDRDNHLITLKYGSVGKEKEVKGKLISYQHNRNKPDYIDKKTPVRDEIIRLISRYNKICRSEDKKIQYDSRYGFNISPTPSTVIIHMKALLQNGNICEPIISDGFSCNVEGLVQYMNADNEKESNKYKADIIRSLFEREVVMKDSDLNEEYIISKRDYYEIYRELDKLSVQTGDSLDSNMIADKINARIIKGCYGALEWTFHYYLIRKQDLGKTIKLLIGNSSYANKMTSSEYVTKHGLKPAETDVTISGADKNSIEKWISESDNGNVIPSLKVLLPIVLCYAHIADEPNFKALALKYPDFMERIEKLHKYANSARHNGVVEIAADGIIENINFSKFVVSQLIPKITIGDAEINAKDRNFSSGYIVNNMINLTGEIGWDLWNSLSDSVKNLLIDLAPDNDKNANTRLSSVDFVMNISQVLEELLYEEIKKLDISEKTNKTRIIEIIENKLGKKIPEEYSCVSDIYYSSALDRHKSTLNAMTLVYLGFVNYYYFEKLKDCEFTEYIMNISKLRGHGNTVNLVMNDEERIKLRNKLFDILKIIGG